MAKYKAAQSAANLDGGKVVGYASTFDREPDAYGDVIAAGAFAETVKAWREKMEQGVFLPLLYGHNTNDPKYNIGRVVAIEEDEKGLKIEAEFDAENEGRMGIGLLLKMMKSRKGCVSRTICCGSAKRIVERESTRPPAPAAYMIERAMKFISENATLGIGPKDVSEHLGISRTLMDLRFREMGDATVGELILERRLAVLSAMLRKSKSPICRAIKDCGFGSVNHAKAVFKKRFGMTMRDWCKAQNATP